jgi:large subunit ribosomal protein L10
VTDGVQRVFCSAPVFHPLLSPVDGVSASRNVVLLTQGRCGKRWIARERCPETGGCVSLNLQEKQAVVAEVSAQVALAQTIVLAEYRGIQVADITKLRANARKSGVYFHVLKNTLARRAVQGTPFEALAEKMVGPLVYSMSADPVAAAKVVFDFAKTNDKLVIKAGSMSGSVMSAEQVAVLAATPSRDELIAKLMATMNATTAKFVRTLAAIRDQHASSQVEGNEAATAA